MHILIFKTNIRFSKEIKRVEEVFKYIPNVLSWHVDREDVDKVLRIESVTNNKEEIINLIKQEGYVCEELMN